MVERIMARIARAAGYIFPLCLLGAFVTGMTLEATGSVLTESGLAQIVVTSLGFIGVVMAVVVFLRRSSPRASHPTLLSLSFAYLFGCLAALASMSVLRRVAELAGVEEVGALEVVYQGVLFAVCSVAFVSGWILLAGLNRGWLSSRPATPGIRRALRRVFGGR